MTTEAIIGVGILLFFVFLAAIVRGERLPGGTVIYVQPPVTETAQPNGVMAIVVLLITLTVLALLVQS
ncbi:MAG: hypothetical protein ACKO4U_11585 [Caldilinea sp.]